MSKPTRIKLGDLAKDTITGFSGVVVAISTCLNNCPRYTIQPREHKDGKPIDAHVFDDVTLERTGKSDVTVVPLVHPCFVVPGAVVRDKLTGVAGVVTMVTQWVNGCVRMAVQPRELKDGVPVGLVWVDAQDAEVLEAAKPKKVATGGPRPTPQRR